MTTSTRPDSFTPIKAADVRAAAKIGQPLRVMSISDRDCGYAHRVSSAKDWSKGYVEVAFDNGQTVWVNPKDLAHAN